MIKQNNRHLRSIISFLMILLCLLPIFTLTGCQAKLAENTVFSVDDLSGKAIGVQLGTTGDILVSDYEKDGSGTSVVRYNKGSDAIQALKLGKIDAVVIDVQPAKEFVSTNKELTILEEEFVIEDYAICIAKNNKDLTASINEALSKLKVDGIIDNIINNYIGEKAGQTPYVSPANVSRDNGTLVMATNAYFKPYEYYENGKITGIDVDLANAIADYLGMTLKIEDMEFDSIITAVQSGKADIGVSGLTVTEDRLKNIDFSDSYTTSQQVIVVRDNNAQITNGNFIENLVEKFKNAYKGE